jgi:hypothetical protein
MKHVNIIQAARLVLKGTPDITPREEKEGVLIGKNLYFEKGIDNEGMHFAFTGDIYLVDDEYEPDLTRP